MRVLFGSRLQWWRGRGFTLPLALDTIFEDDFLITKHSPTATRHGQFKQSSGSSQDSFNYIFSLEEGVEMAAVQPQMQQPTAAPQQSSTSCDQDGTIQYHPPASINQQAFVKSEVDFQRLVWNSFFTTPFDWFEIPITLFFKPLDTKTNPMITDQWRVRSASVACLESSTQQILYGRHVYRRTTESLEEVCWTSSVACDDLAWWVPQSQRIEF